MFYHKLWIRSENLRGIHVLAVIDHCSVVNKATRHLHPYVAMICSRSG